jgi:hypothetical protein
MTHWAMENRRRFRREKLLRLLYYCVYYLYYFRYCVILVHGEQAARPLC